jgi:predicted Zn finger-like uncharacterized protein
MKIACESCGAKYSIADEKVQGKVFKIRCKRCSEVIVVRGDQQGGAAEAPVGAASAPSGEPIWHVVINGDQAGPYSPDQLAEMLANGTVDWDAYVWTEGFDNWVPMRDVETLVSQISGNGAAAAQADARMSFEAQPDAFSGGQPAFGGQPSMGADPFADEPPTTAFGGNIADQPDLFGGGGRAQASPFDSSQHVVASSPSPRSGGGAAAAAPAAAAGADPMTGARNENSVLFSLKNLQALATGSGPSGVPASATAQGSAGYAGGEGSGLIDIRALASATGISEGQSKDTKDELLSIGNQGAFGALGSPMLAPAHDDDGGGKKMMIWAGVAVFGMLLAAGVAAVFIMTRQPPAQPPMAVAPVAPAAAPGAAPNPADEPKEELSEGAKAALEAQKKEEEAAAAANPSGSSQSTRRKPSGDSKPAASESEPAKPSAAAPDKAPAKPSGPRTIDDLLDGALSPGSKPSKPAAAPVASNLPDLPSRDDVVSAMTGVKNAVSACAQGQTGVAFVNVSVAGATGRVTSAEVTGITGPAGSCIAKAVRGASFPKFAQKVFKVKYPFKL